MPTRAYTPKVSKEDWPATVDALRRAMKRRGLSPRGAAAELKLNENTLRGILRDSTTPHTKTRRQVAKWLLDLRRSEVAGEDLERTEPAPPTKVEKPAAKPRTGSKKRAPKTVGKPRKTRTPRPAGSADPEAQDQNSRTHAAPKGPIKFEEPAADEDLWTRIDAVVKQAGPDSTRQALLFDSIAAFIRSAALERESRGAETRSRTLEALTRRGAATGNGAGREPDLPTGTTPAASTADVLQPAADTTGTRQTLMHAITREVRQRGLRGKAAADFLGIHSSRAYALFSGKRPDRFSDSYLEAVAKRIGLGK